MMGVGNRDGESVGGIGAGDGDAGKQPGHHCVDLCLLGAAGPDDCFLDEARRIFADLQSCSCSAHEDYAACLPELQRGLGVSVHEDFLDGCCCRGLVGNQRLEMVCKRREPDRERFVAVGADLAVCDMDEAIALRFDETPASGAKAWIEAENPQTRRSSSSSGTS